ncbi:AF-4 domain containing protein [Pyrenophora teres f. maculata]|nr:AF-4 domain containing protein [Pyrenophora teres f. maculata]
MSARARRLEHSLGSSWGEADYASDEGGSFYSGSDDASELELEDSDKEVVQEPQAQATPRPQRKQLSQSLPTAQTPSTPARKRTNRKKTSQSQYLGSEKKTPSQHPFEPSFIMPSMDNSPSGFDRSPAQKPQPRKRTRNTVQDRLSNASSTSGTSSKEPRADSHQKPIQQDEVSPWHYVSLFWENVAAPLIGHFLDILSYALRHFIKPVLGVLLGVGILVFSIKLASGMLRSTVSNAVLGPVCAIPGSSYLIAACDVSYPSHHVDFDELTNVQDHFGDIIDAAKDTSALPSTIKHSEIAIRDLRILVKHSLLPSRKTLDNEFEYFVRTASEASIDLSRFNSRIGAASDRLVSTNQWTLNVLSGIKEQEASIGTLSRVINQLTGAFVAPPPTLQQRIYDQYIIHVSKNKDEITRLIESAQALLLILNNLDERLATIFEIATNDDQTITRNQEELLSFLWTKLGGNRSDVKANAKSLNLLSNINAYRKKAVVHVSETLLKLQEIQAELENLREGVAAPEILGYRSELPLEYHIEAIGKGIERLQVSRGEHMRVESETYKRLMRGPEEGDGRKELGGPTVTVRAK